MKGHLLNARLSFSVIFLAVIFYLAPHYIVDCARPPPPPAVHINKCCRFGELLERTKECAAGGSDKWVPQVYLIGRKSHYKPRGEAPRFFVIHENKLPTTCSEPELHTGANNIVIFSNGSLFLYESGVFVPPEDYCAEKDSALVCFPQIHGVDSLIAPKKLSKVRKCCGRNMAYDADNKTCIFFNDPEHQLKTSNLVNSSNIEIVYGFPECDGQYTIAGRFRYELLDVETGSLMLDSGKKFASSNFCLEHTIGNDYDPTTNTTFINMFACSKLFKPEPAPESHQDIRFVLYSIGLLISVIFLTATLAAGFLMPSNHHVLHWRCQTYYVGCLLVGDFLLAVSQIFGTSLFAQHELCVSIAIFMHFFFLAAFFWLNTMCFNIWWTFRDFRPTSLEKGQELFRLRIFQGYAWGVPLIIVAVAAILDHIPSGPNESFLRPRFGEKKCWFYGDAEILTFFFGPVGILLCINLLLFASTARQLTCGLWKRDDVKSTTERSALGRVCLKLVIVMGVTWVTDIISWVVGGHQSIWYVTDLINAMQGVFIFVVVGCQPQVWAAVKRIWSTKTGRGVTNTTNGPQHSSSSHGLPSIGESVTNNTLTNTTITTKVPMETVC